MPKIGSIGIVIPARLDSKRLPRKLMEQFNGLPMLEHVRRRALMNSHGVEVVVVSGDDEILTLIQTNGGTALKSKHEHPNGLSRIGEVADELHWENLIILQGDEILVLPRHLDEIIEQVQKSRGFMALNSVTKLNESAELSDVSIVKCLLNENQEIINLFRGQPLTSKLEVQLNLVKKICGLFAINRQILKKLVNSIPTPIETSEMIEQMRILEYGFKLESKHLDKNTPSINIFRDIAKVRDALLSDPEQIKILREVLR